MSRAGDEGGPLDGALARVVALEESLSRLGTGARAPAPFWTRAWDRIAGDGDRLAECPTLSQLSRGLRRLGLQSPQDAARLRETLTGAPRWRALTEGLVRRCLRSVDELERVVRGLERASRRGAELPDLVARRRELASLVRVVRVLEALVSVEKPPLEVQEVPPEALPPGTSFRSPQLAIAAALEARARTGTPAPGPQRELLEVAHALLLRVDPEEDERTGALALRWQMVQTRRALIRQTGHATLSGLLHEVRSLASQDPRQAQRRIEGLRDQARLGGQSALAAAAEEALRAFSDGRPPPSVEEVAHAFGFEAERGRTAAPGALDPLSVELLATTLARDPEGLRLFELARGAAFFLDVDGETDTWGAEEGAAVDATAPERVSWPTSRLEFECTSDPARIRDFVIEDPRRIVLDLASGRQQARVFVEERPKPAPKPSRRSSVRVYVCDASASMQGARARFRDALLLSELEALLLRAHHGHPVDPLSYCYFTDRPGTLHRVADGASALRHLERVLHFTPASGRTDITLALLGAVDAIVQARGRDPDLGRASVVLITDGEDTVDPALLLSAQAPLGDLPVTVSLVSLGVANPALRTLAERQRAKGHRAFYVHLSDADLRWAADTLSEGAGLLQRSGDGEVRVDPALLEPHLEALEQLADAAPALRPVALPGAFAARFSPPAGPGPAAVPRAIPTHVVLGILEALEATVALVPFPQREAECVWLLDHLLKLQGQGPRDWQRALAHQEPAVSAALRRLRLLAQSSGWGPLEAADTKGPGMEDATDPRVG